MIFLDTNILLYSISDHPDDAFKCSRARDLLDRSDIALSAQVLQEFYVQVTRASRSDALPHEDAAQFINVWLRFPIEPISATLVQKALTLKARYKLSYWDCAIIAAALAQGCTRLMSEDMQHGMEIEGLRIENPFS